jgi:hypothetical protein
MTLGRNTESTTFTEAARVRYIDGNSKRDRAAERYSTRANCSEQAATTVGLSSL